MVQTAQPASTFANENVAVLTSFRRDGTGVETPIHVAVDGEVIYAKTWSTSGKAKRIRRNPRVTLAPSSYRSRKAEGQPVAFEARFVEGNEAARARSLIEGKHPILQRLLVRLNHRLGKKETVFFRLTPAPEQVSAAEAENQP